MSSSNVTNINPKDCVYGCNTRIYWNTLISEYWEVFTKKKHICPNRSSNNNKSVATQIPIIILYQSQHITIIIIRIIITTITITRNHGPQSLTINNRWIIL